MSGKLTNINLTIIRGKSDAGKVTVTLSSDKLGNIKAEARLKENTSVDILPVTIKIVYLYLRLKKTY